MLRRVTRRLLRPWRIPPQQPPPPVRAPAPWPFVDDGQFPKVEVSNRPEVWYAKPLNFTVTNTDGQTFSQDVLYSHLTLFAFLKEDFGTVLDIGSHAGNVSNILRFLGKSVTTCEISPGYTADFKADYLDIKFSRRFSAIWCSQVMEHQRNVGIFLNKIFDDLEDGGILALTVPAQVDRNLAFGHCNLFSPLIVVYQLALAGFDCSNVKLKEYAGDICVLLRKRYNGINRALPMGSLPLTEKTRDYLQLLGDEVFPGLSNAFPISVDHSINGDTVREINWPQQHFPVL